MVERCGRKSAKGSSDYFLNAILLCCLVASLSSGWAQATPAQDSAAPATQAAPTATPPQAEPTYKPKFPGDPARSESEAAALGYMRVVLRAQRQFNKQYDHFATTLAELVHSGTFTKRMVDPHRGDYTASFQGKKDSFVLTMTPRQLDALHRSFYAEDDFKIHADETKLADENSPVVK
jgi:hypothetical protein